MGLHFFYLRLVPIFLVHTPSSNMDDVPPPSLADDGINTIYWEWEGEGDDRRLIGLCTLKGRRKHESCWMRALHYWLPETCRDPL